MFTTKVSLFDDRSYVCVNVDLESACIDILKACIGIHIMMFYEFNCKYFL